MAAPDQGDGLAVPTSPAGRAGAPSAGVSTGVRENGERFLELTENLRSIVWLIDAREPRFLYINPAFEGIYGLTRESLDDDPYCWLARVHPDDRPTVERLLAETGEPGWTGYAVEHRVVRPDGSERWLHAQVYPVRDAAGEVVRMVGSGEDVTERHRAEEARRESDLRFRQIAENAHDMFWLREIATGRYLYVNGAYERLFGRRRDEMYEAPGSWLQAVHPDDRERAAGEPDGVFDEEYRVLDADGAVRWVRSRSFPVTDETGAPYRRVGIVEDVTERRLLREQLLQSQKLEAVGRLAGGVAHDFNNLLFVILNYVEEALQAVPPGSQVFDDLRRVVEAGERARSLTDQMLAFSRRQPTARADLDLEQSVRDVVAMTQRALGEDVRVELDLRADAPVVRLDPTQLQQVVLNLAVNARDAMPAGGRLSVSTDRADLPVGAGPPRPQGSHHRPAVALRVSDTGCGMPDEVARRAFEPFFTTKPAGRGTGLGLSTVYGIVESAGGHVSVDSAPGRGTTVTVVLPTLDTGADGPPGPDRTASVDGQGRVALVVEDEELVRHALARQLRRAGFTVHEAPTGDEAVRLCQYQLWRVDLLVTDLVMPGISGRDLVAELGGLGLAPAVVYVSGHAGELPSRELSGPRWRFLQKPFRTEQLLAAIEGLGVAAVG